MLAHQAAAALARERVRHEKLLLRCRLLGRARHFGAHGERRGAGHIVASTRLQLVISVTFQLVRVVYFC